MSKVFTAEFKLEAAKLVLDQHYTLSEAAKAMNVSLSAINRWVKSLRMERQGKMPPGLPLTPELAELREMRKRIQRLEMENEILKKATVDSTCQRNTIFNNFFWCFKFQGLPRPAV